MWHHCLSGMPFSWSCLWVHLCRLPLSCRASWCQWWLTQLCEQTPSWSRNNWGKFIVYPRKKTVHTGPRENPEKAGQFCSFWSLWRCTSLEVSHYVRFVLPARNPLIAYRGVASAFWQKKLAYTPSPLLKDRVLNSQAQMILPCLRLRSVHSVTPSFPCSQSFGF